MVPKTSRYKITVAVLAVIVVLAVLAIAVLVFVTRSASSVPRSPFVAEPVYSATSDELNLAILGGIVKAERATSTPISGTIRAVVVPHHLVASESIARGIKALASSSPRTVVIISPDHYGLCHKFLCTTFGSYRTFFGNVDISHDDVADLLSHPDIVEESSLFTGEHGVYTIVPFIRHYLPAANIVPIAISQRGIGAERSRNEVLQMISSLTAKKGVALVISSDFSHYLSLAQSQSMDEKTTTSLCSGNGQDILHLQNPNQSDCPMCLWTLTMAAQLDGFWNPVIIAHTNSATLLGDSSAQRTTSHFTFLFSTAKERNVCQADTEEN